MQNTRNACRNAHSAFNPLFVEMLLAEITYEPHCTSLQKFMLNIIFPMQMKTIYTFLREHNIFPHFLFYPLLPLTTSIMPSLTIFIPLRLRCISEFRTPLSLYFVPCSLHTSRIRGFPLSMTTNPTIYYTYTSSSLIQSVRMTNIDETHTESMNFIRCHYILLTKLCVGLLDEWRALRDRSPARHHTVNFSTPSTLTFGEFIRRASTFTQQHPSLLMYICIK